MHFNTICIISGGDYIEKTAYVNHCDNSIDISNNRLREQK